jgi:tryptophan synthase alpha chain
MLVYLTVGYPERTATAPLLRAALDGGADLIELGVPFSDPLADGATVQRASEIALKHGVTLADCIGEAENIVRERDVPVLLMGYANPFLRYRRGLADFAADAARAGVAGIIVPDLPAEESAEFDAALGPEGLARIDLYAPTTPDARLARLVPSARGFVYCVSLTGVTGARRTLGPDVGDFVARVRRHTDLPIAVGFGISGAEHVASLRGVADAVVVGSAALDTIAAAPPERRADALRGFVSGLAAAGRA